MKKLLLASCDNCPYLTISSGRYIQCEKDDLEIYKCSNGKVKINHKYKEIGRSDEIPEDNSLIIPKWCPLEDA